MIFEVPRAPGRKLDPGDTPEGCAARELEEEAGRRAGRIEKLGWIFTTPGFTDEVIHLFAAFELEEIPARPEEDEVIEVQQLPLQEALDLVWRGELTDAKSALALVHAARLLGRLRCEAGRRLRRPHPRLGRARPTRRAGRAARLRGRLPRWRHQPARRARAGRGARWLDGHDRAARAHPADPDRLDPTGRALERGPARPGRRQAPSASLPAGCGSWRRSETDPTTPPGVCADAPSPSASTPSMKPSTRCARSGAARP